MLEGAYQEFVDNIVVVNDPYGFRLLVMGKKSKGVKKIKKVDDLPKELDINVLVHRESERRDIIKHLGEQSSGLAFTSNKWVQFYGSHFVKPPIIYGDVSCPKSMSVSYIDATLWLMRSLQKIPSFQSIDEFFQKYAFYKG